MAKGSEGHSLALELNPAGYNDVWIAAICPQHRLALLTLDEHFERVEGLSLGGS